MYVIQLPEWSDVRIAGSGNDWQIQTLRPNGDWRGTNFYSQLQYAVGEMFERTMRDKDKNAKEPNEWFEDCKRVKDSLVRAVKKAVKEAV